MKNNTRAGEVTDMKCINVAEQNAKQSWRVDKLLWSSYPYEMVGVFKQRINKKAIK